MNKFDIINSEFNYNSTFIQIGTNIANDLFTEICIKYKPSKIILVEPNVDLNTSIEKCYSGYNYIIENVVISDKKDKVKLYNNPHTNNNQHFSIKPMKDWYDLSDYIECESITFNDLIYKYNIDKIDFLNIDTEGNDVTILNSIDFNNIEVDKILYEWWGFTNDKHDYDDNLHGVGGMEFIKGKLNSFGYSIYDVYSGNSLTDQFAIKNK